MNYKEKIELAKEWILDATEKLCVISLVLFLWSCAIFLVAVGIYLFFNFFLK